MTYHILIWVNGHLMCEYHSELVPQIGDHVAIERATAVKITKRLLSTANNTIILFANEIESEEEHR